MLRFRSTFLQKQVCICFGLTCKTVSGDCFYVGQAANLENRLCDHLSDDEENECLRKNVKDYICGFEYAKIGRQTDRDGVEKYLYDHYRPECNEVDPGGKPIAVNLP